jgi:hypothetical protein
VEATGIGARIGIQPHFDGRVAILLTRI